MGPYVASARSVEITEATCGPMCILVKPNDEACKIVNISARGG
jgi:hypothetical protein